MARHLGHRYYDNRISIHVINSLEKDKDITGRIYVYITTKNFVNSFFCLLANILVDQVLLDLTYQMGSLCPDVEKFVISTHIMCSLAYL